MRTVSEWRVLLVSVERTTNKELKDVQYITERILTISENESNPLSNEEAWVVARKISKSV